MADAEPMRSPLTTPTGAAAETRLHTAGAASAPSVSDRELPDYRLRFILLLLADGHAYHNAIVTDPMWRSLSAVKNGNVYEAPNGPYNWMGGPPSIQRLLSMIWLGNLMYPDIFDYDIDERVGEFYSLFFRYDLTGAELDDRMVYAKPAPAICFSIRDRSPEMTFLTNRSTTSWLDQNLPLFSPQQRLLPGGDAAGEFT